MAELSRQACCSCAVSTWVAGGLPAGAAWQGCSGTSAQDVLLPVVAMQAQASQAQSSVKQAGSSRQQATGSRPGRQSTHSQGWAGSRLRAHGCTGCSRCTPQQCPKESKQTSCRDLCCRQIAAWADQSNIKKPQPHHRQQRIARCCHIRRRPLTASPVQPLHALHIQRSTQSCGRKALHTATSTSACVCFGLQGNRWARVIRMLNRGAREGKCCCELSPVAGSKRPAWPCTVPQACEMIPGSAGHPGCSFRRSERAAPGFREQ